MTVGLYELRVHRLATVCEAPTITRPADVAPVVQALVADKAVEHFVVVFLDTCTRVSGAQVVSVGSLNASVVHPREVFRTAILHGAASIVLSHNHPSGDPTPSRDDMELTRRLVKSGELLGIKVLDHIIIGDTSISLKEKRLL